MSKFIQSIRGMPDLLPSDLGAWQYIEKSLRDLSNSFGFKEIRTPALESTDLFCRSIGEYTDVVEKEMYTFEDKSGSSLTLRPEGTASVVRAGNQHGFLYNQEQKLWYLGNMFRYERPQKGRLRQFTQFGVELFGYSGIGAELDLLLFSSKLWDALGFTDHVRLEINTIGTNAERQAYSAAFQQYMLSYKESFSENVNLRLQKNPLRLLDSKDKTVVSLLEKAPVMYDFCGEETRNSFNNLCSSLDSLGIKYTINNRLVRGLDYYNNMVFEWVTDLLGSQSAILSGGRYDSLVSDLGGKPTPAVGFAAGLDRLVLIYNELKLNESRKSKKIVSLSFTDDSSMLDMFSLSKELTSLFPEICFIKFYQASNYKKIIKKSILHESNIIIVVNHLDSYTIKFLQEDNEDQHFISKSDVFSFLNEHFK